MQPFDLVYAQRLSAVHFPYHSKIFVALMITPTSFIDKKIFFNQVQDMNPDSIGYTLISLNLIFCLLTYLTKIDDYLKRPFCVFPMGVKQVSSTRLVPNHFSIFIIPKILSHRILQIKNWSE